MKGIFFIINDTETTENYTLSLHDALPISPQEKVDAREARSVDGLEGARGHAANPIGEPLRYRRGHDELDVARARILLRVVEKLPLLVVYDVLAGQARLGLVVAHDGALYLARVQALFDDDLPVVARGEVDGAHESLRVVRARDADGRAEVRG